MLIKLIIAIAILVLIVVLAFKVTKKLIKIALAFVFVGFIVYIITGTDVISEFLQYIGIIT